MIAAPARTFLIRAATRSDIAALETLIHASARALGRGFYTDAETEAAIAHVFGVDSDLIDDGTYLVAEDGDGTILGCGGWSRRRTLFGGDNFANRATGFLDPAEDAARIRAFFVTEAAARRSVGSALLAECEARAAAAGFQNMALMATLPGVPFYAARGYAACREIGQACGETTVCFVPMAKALQ